METLGHQDWLRLHEVVLDLHTAPSLAALPLRILEGVRRLFPFDGGSVQDDHGGAHRIPWQHGDQPIWQPPPAAAGEETKPACGVRVMAPWGPDFLPLRESFFALSGERHPHTDYYRRTGDGSARRLTDIVPVRALRQMGFFQEIVRPQRMRWQLTIYLPLPSAGTLTLAAGRGGRTDFSERERLTLDLLRPHVGAAWVRAREIERQRRALRRLVPLPMEDTAACLRALGRLRLTPREAEVLLWVAQGKTNPEIGIILKTRPATVKTHVEHLLAKLGCETRTAAARVAQEALAGGG